MVHGEKPQTHLIDMNTPSVARMYDALLGGVHNYDVDRKACNELLRIAPSTQLLARNNRAFLRRVVRILVEKHNVTQFLDHGSGLPTQDNVHEVAQDLRDDCRVAYVDNDPMVHAHGRTTLDENDNTMVIDADMRHTARIVEATKEFFDWTQPVAALFVSVLHCLPDTDDDQAPGALIKRVVATLPPASFIVVCQLVSEDPAVRRGVTELMARATGNKWGRVRKRDEVRTYFAGMQVMEPGLVDVVDWWPDTPPPPLEMRATDWVEWGGVARL
ncbi:SAM-dependent methyltransferase [Streptomyces scopuliridis]|uniref:SAM-dependent methyltransferase n=1 Tax=Streptomyces scopuliridis TaxID=452529 RepID=A0ACD4ZSU8_9ACTN|nr:SAM-dependent methyltransferase [Streptomyces scopuliridis]WSC01526.1 SAM-dependent methyltransferase [Streptomyces scopuliridis]WSC04936.1 SAM-dependent methyltransferase [Streptomyces scopuliridis]